MRWEGSEDCLTKAPSLYGKPAVGLDIMPRESSIFFFAWGFDDPRSIEEKGKFTLKRRLVVEAGPGSHGAL